MTDSTIDAAGGEAAPVEDTSASAPVSVVSQREQFREPTSYERTLRSENAKLRGRATAAETSLATKVREAADAAKEEGTRLASEARAEADRVVAEARAEAAAAKAELERVTTESASSAARGAEEAKAAANAKILRSEVKAAAIKAGLVHVDGLKMLDVSKVTLDEHGDAVFPESFFEDAKAAMPFLFGTAPAVTEPAKPATTSSTANVPPATPPTKKKATEMTAAEYREHRREIAQGRRV